LILFSLPGTLTHSFLLIELDFIFGLCWIRTRDHQLKGLIGKTMEEIEKLLKQAAAQAETEKVPDKVVLKGQYKRAMVNLEDARNAELTPALVGPPGTGKTLISRLFASTQERPFYWLTMDEGTRPAHLVGSFDPARALQSGFEAGSFVPGPLLLAMLRGGILLVNEINRATEFLQNSLLEPLEERSTFVPHLGRVSAADGFFILFALNPAEMAGTHRVSEALRDRVKVWISLDYPDKNTELEIIRTHCPECALTEEVLDRIHRFLARTRNHDQIEIPASVRAGIALGRLAASISRRNERPLSGVELKEAAKLVAPGSIKVRPGVNEAQLINSILREVFD
jgi:MoxR-like ATPase